MMPIMTKNCCVAKTEPLKPHTTACLIVAVLYGSEKGIDVKGLLSGCNIDSHKLRHCGRCNKLFSDLLAPLVDRVHCNSFYTNC